MPTPTEVAAYASAAVDLFQQHSYYRDHIDWSSLRAQVSQAAMAGRNRGDTIGLAIALINDNHSYYEYPNGTIIFPFPTQPCIASAPVPPPFVAPSDIGYIAVPAFSETSVAQGVQFALGLQNQVRATDRAGIVGWVVDVRQNGGGNIYPMLTGVGPVLGDGTAGFFVDPHNVSTPFGYSAGMSWSPSPSTGAGTSVADPYHLMSPPQRIAVLTDSRTNSAGELIVVAFSGVANTRRFGGPTCGRSTAITGYVLSDGATLGVMTALDADRTGFVYGGVINPDETILDPTQLSQRVIAWLRSGQ